MPVTHQDFNDHLNDSLDYISEWDYKAREDYRMMGLQQWPDEAKKSLRGVGAPSLVFDRLRPLVQAIAGAQATSRYMSTFIPREFEGTKVDKQVSKGAREWMRWVQQVGDWEHEESLAFLDCLTCGVGVLEMYITHDEDPDGRIQLRRRPVWEVLWDSASVQSNMKDGRFILADKWLSVDELASIFGQEHVQDVLDMAGEQEAQTRTGFWEGFKGVFTRTTEQRYAYDLNQPRDWDDRFYEERTGQVRLFEWQRYEREYRVRVIGQDLRDIEEVLRLQAQGQPIPMLDSMEEKDNADDLMQELSEKATALNMQSVGMADGEFEPPVSIADFPVRYYYRSWHTRAGKLMEEKMPHGFSYMFLTCHEDWSEENARYFFGLVRQGKDPQKYTNKFLSQAIHLFNSNPKGALIYEEGIFSDKLKIAEEWNKATGLLPVKRGSITTSNKLPFEHLTSNVSLRSIEGLLSFAQGATPASMGLSEAVSLGQVADVRRVSGDAFSSMMEQNIKTQSAPFDSLRLYRKMVGRLTMEVTDAFIDPERVLQVIGEEDAIFIQALLDGDLKNQYSVIAEEAPQTKSEKDRLFTALYESGIIPQMMSQGVPMPPEMAEFFPGTPEMTSMLRQAFQKAYEVQVLSLEVQKMQLMQQIQMGGQPPPGQEGQGGGQSTQGQPVDGGVPQ